MSVSEPAPALAPTHTFEGAMERLETLVEQMENARLPLEELIRSYEEGIQLVRVCNERLSAAEQRIETITRDAAGKARAIEFTGAAAQSPAMPAKASHREPGTLVEAPPAALSPIRPPKNPNEVSLF